MAHSRISPSTTSQNGDANIDTIFNGQRLGVARRRRAMSKVALAAQIGTTPGAITQYEASRRQPREDVIDKFSTALSFPHRFFAGDDLVEPPQEGTNFRALSKMSVRERERSIAAGSIALMLSDWIDERYECPDPALPDLAGLTPQQAASALRDFWRLGDEPIDHMIEFGERAGIRIFSLPRDCVNADAFSFWLGERPFLFVDTLKSAERRRWDVAHEIGHLVLHALDAPRSREREREADEFAAHFLMPHSSVLAHAPRRTTIRTLLRAKEIWGVSLVALIRRMHDLGLIRDWERQMLFMRVSKHGWRRSEPNEVPVERSVVLSIVLDKLAKSGVAVPDIAAELCVYQTDLRQFLFEFEPKVIHGGKAMPA